MTDVPEFEVIPNPDSDPLETARIQAEVDGVRAAVRARLEELREQGYTATEWMEGDEWWVRVELDGETVSLLRNGVPAE